LPIVTASGGSENETIGKKLPEGLTVERLEAKDVLPNINRMQAARMQAAERAENVIFVPGDLYL